VVTDIETFLKKVKKLAARTRDLYGEHLGKFSEWCQTQNITTWEMVTPDIVETYLEHRASWATSTRWSALCAIRRFARWKYGDSSPLIGVTMERKGSPPQRTLNRGKTNALLGLFDTSTPKGTRDLAIVTLALDSGLRENELVSIQLDYLDFDPEHNQGTLFVPIKGGEWEPAAFYEYTTSCLLRWLGVRSTVAKPGVSTLFVSIGGTTRGQSITKDGLRAIFRRFSIHSEIGLISPHDLRRTFATLAVEAGAPTRAVQVAGRWKHIKMVELYTRALEARVLHRYSPVNRLMGVKPTVEGE
jgi:integrase/recombinase XerD